MKSFVLLDGKKDKSVQDFIPHLVSEEIEVFKLYKDGKIRELYYHADRPTLVILVLETNTEKEATEIVENLPLVKANLFDVTIIPVRPFTGHAVLFDPKHGIPPLG